MDLFFGKSSLLNIKEESNFVITSCIEVKCIEIDVDMERSVYGRVITCMGEPLSAANVSIGYGAIREHCISDQYGSFRTFLPLQNCKCEINAWKPGYEPINKKNFFMRSYDLWIRLRKSCKWCGKNNICK